jgi:hypothetical protein
MMPNHPGGAALSRACDFVLRRSSSIIYSTEKVMNRCAPAVVDLPGPFQSQNLDAFDNQKTLLDLSLFNNLNLSITFCHAKPNGRYLLPSYDVQHRHRIAFPSQPIYFAGSM